jgi:hypothetical protein
MQTVSNLNHLVHAYKIAPWRMQRQWIGNALLVVVALGMIATLYLYVTSRAAIAGREIQDLAAAMTASQHTIADLQTQHAGLTSTARMQERALELGYTPIGPSVAEYIIVAGYITPIPDILTIAPQPGLQAPSIPPEFNQSLLEWLNEQIHSPYKSGALQ